ncbi:hypothetical protein B5X24_HaOG209321 [Helicoverpa armigera]|nr:hypothetical protein B5X24_HaOG209321 [Helicoverpa armigera]
MSMKTSKQQQPEPQPTKAELEAEFRADDKAKSTKKNGLSQPVTIIPPNKLARLIRFSIVKKIFGRTPTKVLRNMPPTNGTDILGKLKSS